MFNFENRMVLVTGAARSMGEEIARMFLESGATVIAGDIQTPVWESEKNNDNLLRINLDVSNEDVVVEQIGAINKHTSGIDILVNCAGVTVESPISEMTLEQWEKPFDVNAKGTFLCTREVTKNLMDRGKKGSIINIASIAGRNALPGSSSYCASKAAVIGFTRAAAIEFGKHDINVNAICPGSVQTSVTEKAIENIAESTGLSMETAKVAMEAVIPMQRFQTTKDIAGLTVYLASELGRNINGETINIDGGVIRN